MDFDDKPALSSRETITTTVRVAVCIQMAQQATAEQALRLASRYHLLEARAAWRRDRPEHGPLEWETFHLQMQRLWANQGPPPHPGLPAAEMPRPQQRGAPTFFTNTPGINHVMAMALETEEVCSGFVHLASLVASRTEGSASSTATLLLRYTTDAEMAYLRARHPPRNCTLNRAKLWKDVVWPELADTLSHDPLPDCLDTVGERLGFSRNRLTALLRTCADRDQKKRVMRAQAAAKTVTSPPPCAAVQEAVRA